MSYATATINELFGLRDKVGLTTASGFKARVRFVQLAYRHNLVHEITSYQLWDRGFEGLGERTFDTCFEMGDSPEVIAELIRDARTHGYAGNIEMEVGNPDCFARWCGYADRQQELAF
ncbi:TPA: hypothetical protein ACQRN8_003051 [Pseudomonas aeruginosa]